MAQGNDVLVAPDSFVHLQKADANGIIVTVERPE